MSTNGYVDWGDVAPPDGGTGNKIDYLRLRTGNKYKIRPVHRPVHIFKYFHRNEKGELRTAICKDPKVCTVASSHPDLQAPSSRYAIYVFDRTDGKLKVMEGPKTVFLPFRQRFEVTGKDPAGSTTGGDWLIDIQGTGKATKYTLTYIEDTPLTQNEIEEVDAVLNNEDGQLKTLYKPHSPEAIEKRLFLETSSDDSNNFTASIEQSSTESKPEQSSGDQSKKFNMSW